MGISEVISLLGGVALFLFGMTLMGDGLKRVAGNKLELILYRLSGTPLKGLLLGTGVTAVIQSSSATSVMVVGFVNSGMMKLKNSVSVIIGSIIGTSITGWVICLSYIEGGGSFKTLLSTATLTGVIAVIGIILRLFTKNQFKRHIGDILMGFSVLMFGMSAMSGAVAGLGEAPWFLSLLTGLSNPLMGILVGAAFSAVLQSASAAVGIIQALSVTGAMGVSQTLPLLMGVAIGAAVPILLASVGASSNGKRAALIYPVASIIGTALIGTIFYALNAFLHFSFLSSTVNPFSVATVNTIMRLAMLPILMPMSGAIMKIISLIVKEPAAPEESSGPALRLEERFLTHPALAIEQCRVNISAMAQASKKSVSKAIRLLWEYSEDGFNKVKKMEKDVDVYEDRLGAYLTQLTGREMTDRQNAAVAEFLHSLTDYERISDHARNIAESAKEMNDKGIHFSGAAKNELNVLTSAVNEILHLSIRAFETYDADTARSVEPLEDVIDDLCDEIKSRHIERIRTGVCSFGHGYVYNDILTNLERIADHSSNLAIAVMERKDRSFDSHGYLKRLKAADREAFNAAYDAYAERYSLDGISEFQQ
ncbi:MAG: Na/Pi cotransporter family protein [Oscillospiraceae bacterium]|nr:Na/Pi cotransporter family protein [Oscillospiraceae bacterium]